MKLTFFIINLLGLSLNSIYSGLIISFQSVDQKFFEDFNQLKMSKIPIYGDSLTQTTKGIIEVRDFYFYDNYYKILYGFL